MAVAASTAIGIAVAVAGWLLTHLVGRRDRSTTELRPDVEPEPNVPVQVS